MSSGRSVGDRGFLNCDSRAASIFSIWEFLPPDPAPDLFERRGADSEAPSGWLPRVSSAKVFERFRETRVALLSVGRLDLLVVFLGDIG